VTEYCAVIGTHSMVRGDKLLYGQIPDPFPRCGIGSGNARLLLTQLQTAVLHQKSAIRTQIRKYQQSYFNQHMNPPPSSDPTLKTLIKQRDVAIKLLQTWNIEL